MLTRVILLAALAGLATPPAAFAASSHWFYRAKINLGKERVYDVDVEGLPLADKRQGRSRTRSKLFGLVSVDPLKICLAQGEWAAGVALLRQKDEGRFDFIVSDCLNTRIRVHFDRPVESGDYAPAAIARYLSGIFEIRGFDVDGLTNALGAALTEVGFDDSTIRVGALQLPRTSDYRSEITRYGGGLRMLSTQSKGKRYLWSKLIMGRPMTPEEAALGAPALLEEVRRDQSRLLNATYGKKLKKKLDIAAGSVDRASHLSVQHIRYTYRRRDWIFDDASSKIYYLETTAGRGKKDRVAVDEAVTRMLAGARFHQEEPPLGSLTSLTEIPEATADDLGAAESYEQPVDSTPQTYDPSIEMVSVSVQPAEVNPGGEVKLLRQSEVKALPHGPAFQVVEQRHLLLDGEVIGSVEEKISRSAGSYTSSRAIQTPPDARPGFYALRAVVSVAGVEAEGSAFFRVK